MATDAGVLLTKMKIDRVNRSGHSHRSLQMAAMDMERLDEGPALDQFYGVVPVGIIRYDLSGRHADNLYESSYVRHPRLHEGAVLRRGWSQPSNDRASRRSRPSVQEERRDDRDRRVGAVLLSFHQARRPPSHACCIGNAIFRASTGGPSPRACTSIWTKPSAI